MAQQPHIGPVPPQCRAHSVVLWTSDQPDAETSTWQCTNTQHSQETDIHVTGGIQTHNPSKCAASDLQLRPCDHWDQPFNLQGFKKIFPVKITRLPKSSSRNYWTTYGIL